MANGPPHEAGAHKYGPPHEAGAHKYGPSYEMSPREAGAHFWGHRKTPMPPAKRGARCKGPPKGGKVPPFGGPHSGSEAGGPPFEGPLGELCQEGANSPPCATIAHRTSPPTAPPEGGPSGGMCKKPFLREARPEGEPRGLDVAGCRLPCALPPFGGQRAINRPEAPLSPRAPGGYGGGYACAGNLCLVTGNPIDFADPINVLHIAWIPR